jgi:hypothetical protein
LIFGAENDTFPPETASETEKITKERAAVETKRSRTWSRSGRSNKSSRKKSNKNAIAKAARMERKSLRINFIGGKVYKLAIRRRRSWQPARGG